MSKETSGVENNLEQLGASVDHLLNVVRALKSENRSLRMLSEQMKRELTELMDRIDRLTGDE